MLIDEDAGRAEQLAANVRSLGRRATLTKQGEYMLETDDFLLIPPGTSHRNVVDMATIWIILYTRKPVRG